MKKYVGELGLFLPTVTLVYDEGCSDQRILLKSIHQVFNSFINLRMINERNLLKYENRKYFLNQTEIIVTTSMKSLKTLTNNRIFQKKTLIGFFDVIEQENEISPELNFSSLDRVVTINDRTFKFLSKYIDRGKIRKTHLALDLRPFYGIKENSEGNEFSKIGLPIREIDMTSSIFSEQLLPDLLDAKNISRIVIQPKNLTDRSYSLLKEGIPATTRKEVVVLDCENSFQQQIEFFKSIDVYLQHSDSLELDILQIQAEAAGLDILEKKQSDYLSASLNEDVLLDGLHPNDFRSLKFEYLRVFFADGIEVKHQRTAIVVPADAGFFSVFNTLISIKAHWAGIHGFSSISADWSIKSVLDFWKVKEMTSYCYASKEEGNVFNSLFQTKNNLIDDLTNHKAISNVHDYTSKEIHIHSPNLFADPDFTYVYADRLYRGAGFQNWRNEMNATLKNLRPNESILNRINGLFQNISDEDLVIGMHVRHPSHAMEQPNSEIPISEDYIRVARELLAEKRSKFRKVLVFLATDQDAVVEEFRNEFGHDLLVFDDVTRVTNQQTSDFQNLSEKQKLQIGAQVQHIAAKDPRRWSSKLAEEIITDAWALGRCQILLHAVSNVATAVTFINPELESLPIRRGDTYESIKIRKHLWRISSVL
jgi:hypothetical protein